MTQILPTQAGTVDPGLQPLTDVEQVVAYLAEGAKDARTLKVGMEHEKPGVFLKTGLPIPFEGPGGVEDILKRLAERFDHTPIVEDGRTIALMAGKASISLEPGGQLELSGAPWAHMADAERELDEHLAQVRAVAEPLGVGFYGLGYRPDSTAQNAPRMPKARYVPMHAYMQRAGTRGIEMMLCTSTVQANLDFVSEADMGEKFRVAMGISGITTALFAASPFAEGKPCGLQSRRMLTWTDTDNTRAGLLRFALERNATFRDYVDWAWDVPLIFIRRGAEYRAAPTGLTLRGWMKDGGKTLPPLLMSDWVDLMSTLFPDVRLKQYLEVRTADTGDRAQLLALPAFFKGILYSATARQRAWALVEKLDFAQHLALKEVCMRDGLHGRLGPLHVGEVAEQLCRIAQDGLAQQGLPTEGAYVQPMLERAQQRRSLSDRLLEHGGTVTQAALAVSRLC